MLTLIRQNVKTKSNSAFEKGLFKFMYNAMYGKTMENVREHVACELVDNLTRIENCLNSPVHKHRRILNGELIRLEKTKAVAKLNKSNIVMAIIKNHWNKFYYGMQK